MEELVTVENTNGQSEGTVKKKNSIFLPKGTVGRKKALKFLHYESFLLMIMLKELLKCSVALIGKTIRLVLLSMIPDSLWETIYDNLIGILPQAKDIIDWFVANKDLVFLLFNIYAYGGFVITLILTILVLFLMKKQIKNYKADTSPMENPIRVKKAKYVWLGLLLGPFGAHLFAIKKKWRAVIYIVLTILGFQFSFLALYTMGMSFADAFLACYLPKQEDKCIEIEDYPYIF